MVETIKALALMSGGLDSTLSAKLIQNQGIEVEGINFSMGFCLNLHFKNPKKKKNDIHFNDAVKSGEKINIPVEVIDISDGYLDVLLNPKYGYGSNVNPCIDCRIYMFKKAKKLMEEKVASFIITGEVVAQRPMSQYKQTIFLIEKKSALDGLIVRPLTAKILPETIPELKGWINRSKLFDINGRSRKRQIQLANELGISEFSQPAGGCCFLTEKAFAKRFKDLIDFVGKDNITTETLNLLKVGRHFRISEKLKIIVGRNEPENMYLECFSNKMMKFRPVDVVGPTTVADGTPDNEEINLIASINALYSDGKPGNSVKIEIEDKSEKKVINIKPFEKKLLEKFRI